MWKCLAHFRELVHISKNWCMCRSGYIPSTYKHSYTFTSFFAPWISHLRTNSCTHLWLHMTSMLTHYLKDLHNFLHTMTHLKIHERTYTLTLCFQQWHINFAIILAFTCTHTLTCLYALHTHLSHIHICAHTYILHLHTNKNAFDQWIDVCNMKCNLNFVFEGVK